MDSKEEKLLEKIHKDFIDTVMMKLPASRMDKIAIEDVMGYGTTVEEKIFDIAGLKKVVELQKQQSENIQFDFSDAPVHRRITNDSKTAIFVDEINVILSQKEDRNELSVRLTSVYEFLENSWKLVHWHGSTGVETEADPFHLEEWKRKNEELQKQVKEKTADLSKKNRELEIEAALERVRSRSMAMQNSEELADLSFELVKQVHSLGVPNWFCAFNIYDEDKKGALEWGSNAEGTYPSYRTPREGVFLRYFEKGQKGETLFINEIGEDKCPAHYDYLCSLPGVGDQLLKMKEVGLSFPTSQIDHVAFFKYGYILFITFDPAPEAHDIFKRFAKGFEQTYTRFLDLQRAEAQAREAQIEAGLERVRSRSLAMHHTSELQEVIHAVHQELIQLNIAIQGGSFITINTDIDSELLCWGSGGTADTSAEVHVPHFEMPFCTNLLEGIKKGPGFFTEEFSQKEKKDYFTKLFKVQPWSNLDPAQKQETLSSLNGYTRSVAVSKYTSIYIINHNGRKFTEAENDILKRFAKTFEQAYTRFLDLQKAEAQAREAQIEAVLERIRSKSLAMYKTDDLGDVVSVLFKQMQALSVDMGFASVSIFIFEEGSRDIYQWIQLPDGVASLHVPYVEHPISSDLFDAKDIGADYFSKIYSVEEKNSWLEKGLELTDYKNLPEEFKTSLLEASGYAISITLAKNSGICIPSFVGSLPSAEDVEIMKRVGKVFEQTYTRFLDLQKAEASAREAQIEAALEKVRSRTMAMQKGEELKEVVVLLYKELIALGLTNFATCGYVEINEEIKRQSTWVTSPGGDSLGLFYLPLTGDAYFDARYAAWKQQQIVFHQTVAGENRRKHLEYAITTFQSKEAEEMVLGQFPDPCVFYCFNFSHGYLHIVTGSQLEKEEESLMARFTKVFEQTYARFLDLQKAEAQAREAQIEASLERVRGRTLAMHNSEELAETASVVFKQLIDLGISPNRLYIGIVKGDSGDIEFWVTDEDGTKISTKFTGNKNFNESVNKMYKNWAQQQKSLTIDMQGKELEDYLNYIGDELQVPFKQRHTYKRRIQTIAFFSKGFIGIASPDEQAEETTRLLERFASGFNLTFTRFSDLKIAEANALKAQQDLIEIKEARKKAENALVELQATQKQLIQSEKMASLGELTAGIAHEIQNPLNFVNNFSEVSEELVLELKEELDNGDVDEAKIISDDVIQNLKKINHHGHRASNIVKGMLEHSRTGDGKKELSDINLLADEYLRLAYHGLRAKDKSFNANFKLEADEKLPKIKVVPQDIGRVMLNLMNNAFYAVAEKTKQCSKEYKPCVIVTTKNTGNKIEIRVKDNGNGVPNAVKEKIFQPFFTTKPTGLGTGLGLSLSYDIIQAHGGDFQVKTKEGQETIFIVTLPA